MHQSRTFRLTGVKRALTQTLLSNARLNYTQIKRFGVDKDGVTAYVLTTQQATYVNVGEVPAPHQAFMRSLKDQHFVARTKVLGGGWSIQTPDGTEVARYGDYDDIPPHHIVAVQQGDYEAVRLNHGLEVTIDVGLPEPKRAALKPAA
jgi:hypothetical protein